MGPVSRYLGPLVPAEPLLWQDPVPAVDHALVGEPGHRRVEEQDSGFGAFDFAAGGDGMGIGLDLPRQRQARWCQRCARSSCAAEVLGGEPAGGTRQGADCAGEDPGGLQRGAGGRQESVAGRPDRAGRMRSGGSSGEKGAGTTWTFRSRRAARMRRRSRRMCIRSQCWSRRWMGSATTSGKGHSRPAAELLVDRANLLTPDRA